MSLRDQLLKKGLASKQQAKKAAKAARKVEHQNKTAKGTQAENPQGVDEVQLKIAKDLEARKAKDRQLNEDNLKAQQNMKAIQLVYTQGQLESEGARIPYFFRLGDKAIVAINVNRKQQGLLSEGELGIATLQDDRFYLLDKDSCLQLKLMRPDLLVCFHQ